MNLTHGGGENRLCAGWTPNPRQSSPAPVQPIYLTLSLPSTDSHRKGVKWEKVQQSPFVSTRNRKILPATTRRRNVENVRRKGVVKNYRLFSVGGIRWTYLLVFGREGAAGGKDLHLKPGRRGDTIRRTEPAKTHSSFLCQRCIFAFRPLGIADFLGRDWQDHKRNGKKNPNSLQFSGSSSGRRTKVPKSG